MAGQQLNVEVYKPSPGDPFDRVKAAHLLNRAAFGGTTDEIDKVLKMGPVAAVDWLLDFPNKSADEQDSKDVPDLSAIDGIGANFKELRGKFLGKSQQERKELMQQIRMANRDAFLATFGWWMKRMASPPHPLQEKLTLFWHGHFTTSFREERSALLIWEQNELLRQFAAGNFAEMLKRVSKDPAMLDYLNNNQNRKDHPNENYAREVMELFTLGIGNYSEADIKEAARAFTGWMHDGTEFVFNRRQHDPGMKHFLGKSGRFTGEEILDIILDKPQCAKFIAGEMFEFFAYPNPEPEMIEALADVFREAKYELRPLIKAILTSREFYSDSAIGTQIKSPVQLVTGTIHLLGIAPPPPQQMMGALQLMGQVPLMPPNVKGWPGGETWINASTMFTRYNSGVRLAQGPINFADLSDRTDPDQVVDMLVERFIQRPIGTEKRSVLVDGFKSRPRTEQAIREVVQLIVSMPEYQLC